MVWFESAGKNMIVSHMIWILSSFDCCLINKRIPTVWIKVKTRRKIHAQVPAPSHTGILLLRHSAFGVRPSQVAVGTRPPCSTIRHPVTKVQVFLRGTSYAAPIFPCSPAALQGVLAVTVFPVAAPLVASSPVSSNFLLSNHLKHGGWQAGVCSAGSFLWNWS